MNHNVYNLMNWPDIEELVYSECSNPHRLLGAHMCKEGMLIQIFRPDAVEVKVNIAGRKKDYPCEKVDEAGWFAVLIPVRKLTAYTVTAEDVRGHKVTYIDPYACDTALTQEQLKKAAVGDDYAVYNTLGAHEMTVNGIRGVNFAVLAPEAVRVSVVGNFNQWDGRVFQMKKHEESGVFELFIPEMKAGEHYKYEIKFKGGNIALKTDPYCMCCDATQDYASVVYTPKNFKWQDSDWLSAGRKINYTDTPLSVCEISPDDLKCGKSFEEMAETVKMLGYTHVELTAAAEYGTAGMDSSAVVAYFAPAGIYGTPDDFKKMVNAFHKNNIGVIIKWNVAFMSNDKSGLTWFDGREFYETSSVILSHRPELKVSTFNMHNPQVRGFLIANALMWTREYHVDGLRVDELASLMYLDYGRRPGEWIPNIYGGNENLDAADFFRQLRKQLEAQNMNVLLIAEDSSAWPRVTGTSEDALQFDFKWNDTWRKDFWSFLEQDALFRKGVYHKLTDSMLYNYSEDFMLEFSGKQAESIPVLQDWEKAANLRLAYAYLYMYPGKKMLNFRQSGVLQEKYRKALNDFYMEHEALYELDNMPEGFEWVNTSEEEKTILAFMRNSKTVHGEKEQLLVVVNFTPVLREDFRMGVCLEGKYREIFNSDSTEYGGQGYGNSELIRSEKIMYNGFEDSVNLTLPPLSVTVYSYEPYTEIEQEEISIKQEAVKARLKAEQEAVRAENLRIKAEEEAKAAVEAEQRAKQAAKAALEAKLEAEKQAEEAEQLKIKIEEETKKKLKALEKKKLQQTSKK
ncbi:MAG: alpha amylase C-terminal domain-containing protein [Lachnospira sp.]|nr:alpha amylase C-terminal domain-containing protein [Lachnospira sp.]